MIVDERSLGFADFGDTVAEKAALLAELAAKRALAETQAQAALSALRVGLSAARTAVYSSWGVSPLIAVISSQTQQQTLANLLADEGYIGKLAGPYLSWARAGKRDDGSAYSWEKWFGFASDVADDIYYQVTVDLGVFWSAGAALVATGRRIVEIVARLLQLGYDVAAAAAGIPVWLWGAMLVAGVALYFDVPGWARRESGRFRRGGGGG